MNERTKQIASEMTPWERLQYRNHQGMIQFLDTIRNQHTELTDAERRAKIREQNDKNN